jgi:outer membrane protein assembly factor BamB
MHLALLSPFWNVLQIPAAFLGVIVSGVVVEGEDAPEVRASIVLPGEVDFTARRLEAADKLAAAKRWAEAVEEYQRLLHEVGDHLVPLDLQSKRESVQARRLCHLRLASLPAEALALYRKQVDVQAQKWLQQAQADHVVGPLHRLVDEAFCSRVGGQALELLGDLAFEKGDFDEALIWWRMVATPAGVPGPAKNKAGQRLDLLFPDPPRDLVARVRAKQIVARLFHDDWENLDEELQAYRKLHGKAVGTIAGHKGPYAATLSKLIQQARKHGPHSEHRLWTTFGGTPARNLVLPRMPDAKLWEDGPTWRVRLLDAKEDADPDELNKVMTPTGLTRRLAFHPLIAGDQVLVADARSVTAYQLLTGTLRFRYDLAAELAPGLDKVPGSQPLDVRYTLSVAGDCVYACLGATSLSAGLAKKVAGKEEECSSYLVCLDLKPGKNKKGHKRWHVKATATGKEGVAFEGAPLVHQGQVYLGLSRFTGTSRKSAVICYDAETGKQLWRQEVCETRLPETGPEASPRRQPDLLTLAGNLIIHCSHSGAIVALDAFSGKRVWAVRYPSRAPKLSDEDLSPCDLTPCVYASGRLYAAPQDLDHILCLDPGSGRTLWGREGIEVVHLLGVARGRLIFTTPQGIRAVDALSGDDAGGWLQPEEGKLPGLGRGCLAGEWIFWPTQDPKLPLRALHILDGRQEKGEQTFYPVDLRQIQPGNMVLGNGCLAVAGTEELFVYVAPLKRAEVKP